MAGFALGACLIIVASVSQAQVVLRQSRFVFPMDGQPNNNGPIGPFCCTGRTATLSTVDGYVVGHVYYHDFRGGVSVDNTSFATDLTLLISAAVDPSNPESPHEKREINFRAEEMEFKASRSVNVGALSFLAWIGKAPRRTIDGQVRYMRGSVEVWLQVSVLEPAAPGAGWDLPPEGGQNPPASDLPPGGGEDPPPVVAGSADVPPAPEQTTNEPLPPEDYRSALARGLAGLIKDKLFGKKANRAACSLQPDSGPCDAARERYYYNPSSGRCEAFTWGGCQGVVPFDSLRACTAACEGR